MKLEKQFGILLSNSTRDKTVRKERVDGSNLNLLNE